MLKAIGCKKNLLDLEHGYYELIEDLLESEHVQKMKEFIQHGGTSCFQHCINVSYYNYIICKFLSLDAKSGARAGLLHDMFLYDWHSYVREKGQKLHGFTHALKALENVEKYFWLNEIEKDIIKKHMFPLNLFAFPKYRETAIIILVDKYCGLLETVGGILLRARAKKSAAL